MESAELRRLIVRHRHVAPMLSVLLAGTNARVTITDAAGEMILDADDGPQVVVLVADDLPTVTGDRDRLIQVVINLISNAVKFTPTGTITVTAHAHQEGVVVGVADTGVGIAPEDHDKVFEQFGQAGDTLTDKPRGTGLGLPICREIVEHHGGRLWLDSAVGAGSTLRFTLPAPLNGDPAPPARR